MRVAPIVKAVKHLEMGEWQAAHEIVQKDEESALSCWAHGIVHVLEGDLPNARYWYRQNGETLPSLTLEAEWEALKAKLTDKAQ
jgi:hypothetical protein